MNRSLRDLLHGPPLRLPTAVDRSWEWWAGLAPRARTILRALTVLAVVLIVARPRPHPWGAASMAVVSARPLAAGTVLSPNDVHLAPWPVALLPDGTLDATAAASGRVLAHAVGAGTPLTTGALGPRSPADLAPTGWVAMPVTEDLLPPLATGTVLDVHGGDGGSVSGAMVLAILDGQVWLAVPRADGPVLAAALAWGAPHVAVWAGADQPRAR